MLRDDVRAPSEYALIRPPASQPPKWGRLNGSTISSTHPHFTRHLTQMPGLALKVNAAQTMCARKLLCIYTASSLCGCANVVNSAYGCKWNFISFSDDCSMIFICHPGGWLRHDSSISDNYSLQVDWANNIWASNFIGDYTKRFKMENIIYSYKILLVRCNYCFSQTQIAWKCMVKRQLISIKCIFPSERAAIQ